MSGCLMKIMPAAGIHNVNPSSSNIWWKFSHWSLSTLKQDNVDLDNVKQELTVLWYKHSHYLAGNNSFSQLNKNPVTLSDITVLTFLCTCNNEIPLILQLAILSLPLPTSLMSCLMPCLLVEHYDSGNLPRLTGNLNSLAVCILNYLFWTNLGRPEPVPSVAK